jgi:phosphate/sulfate permease
LPLNLTREMTNGLAYLAALVLGAVFAYSGVTKLRDPHPTRRALRAARVRGGGVAVGILAAAEIITAASLVVSPFVGAVFSLILLALFTLFIVYLLMKSIDVSCGCFGANATKSVSIVDVLRNAFLVLTALVASTTARPAAVAIEEVIAVTTATAIATVLLAAVGTRRELGQLFDNRLPGER